jgi:hypothetical protein
MLEEQARHPDQTSVSCQRRDKQPEHLCRIVNSSTVPSRKSSVATCILNALVASYVIPSVQLTTPSIAQPAHILVSGTQMTFQKLLLAT